LAICLGAPFWFDILNKIANLRGTGPKPVVADDSGGKNNYLINPFKYFQ
jgi:hypothetical protein